MTTLKNTDADTKEVENVEISVPRLLKKKFLKRFFQNLGIKGTEIIGSHNSYSRIQAKIPLLLLSTGQTELILSPVMLPLEPQALVARTHG